MNNYETIDRILTRHTCDICSQPSWYDFGYPVAVDGLEDKARRLCHDHVKSLDLRVHSNCQECA